MNIKQLTQRTSMNHSKWSNQISSFLNLTGLFLDHLLHLRLYQWMALRMYSHLRSLLLVIWLITLNKHLILIQIFKILSNLPISFNLLVSLPLHSKGKKMIFLRLWNSNLNQFHFRHLMDSSIIKIHLTTVILILLLQVVVLILNLIEASKEKYLSLIILKHTAS